MNRFSSNSYHWQPAPEQREPSWRDSNSMNEHATLPRHIFTYWDQGFGDAPFVVRMCLGRLKQLHPRWKIHLLDRESVWSWLPSGIDVTSERWRRLCIPHQSDLIRTKLLVEHGGIWMDPTVFCMRRLEEWLPPIAQNELLFFRDPGADRLISNWFIASQPGNRRLEIFCQSLCQYWNGKRPSRIKKTSGVVERRIGRIINRNTTTTRLWMTWPLRKLLQTTPHMIYHYLINDLVARDPDFSEALRSMPRFSAAEAHLLQRIGLLERASPEIVEKIEHASSPLFKLNWRLPDQAAPDSILYKLASLLPAQLLERDEKARTGHV